MLPTIFGMQSYQLINLTASIICIIYITIFLKSKHKIQAFITAVLYVALGLVLSRLLWVSYDFEHRFTTNIIFRFKYGLMDLGGVFLAMPIIMFISHKLFKIEYKNLFNTMVEGMVITAAIAKTACFCAGCCYGVATDVPWAIKSRMGMGLVHPVQLYESAIWVVVYIAIMLTKNRMNNINRVCLITLGCICMRMPVESLRYDAKMFIEGRYWVAYKILLVVCIIGLIINNRHKIKQLYNKIKLIIKRKQRKALPKETE